MTLSTPLTARLGIFALALVYTGLTFSATTAPVSAKNSAPYYTAELAQPAKENRMVARGVAWKCEGTSCRAKKGNSRPIRICRGLVRKMGEVTSFTARGEKLAEDKMAKCNGK